VTAKQILDLRKRLGLTQGQFAARLKVDPKTISMWERGAGRPGLRSIQKLRRLQRKLRAA